MQLRRSGWVRTDRADEGDAEQQQSEALREEHGRISSTCSSPGCCHPERETRPNRTKPNRKLTGEREPLLNPGPHLYARFGPGRSSVHQRLRCADRTEPSQESLLNRGKVQLNVHKVPKRRNSVVLLVPAHLLHLKRVTDKWPPLDPGTREDPEVRAITSDSALMWHLLLTADLF